MIALSMLILAAWGSSADEPSATEDNQNETTNSTQPTTETASLKGDYLKKLNETKEEMDELRANPTDSSTYAMKNAEVD
ncbi:hypothetical protein [Bacillus sp. PS06]|uniref:hypothetical protein n=1 Tax=Bacillus sp. PS06 TaxID=2764176 RepID=UPI001CD87FBA|nr:hypothetical protein [Bacillus sp. PS06]